MKKNEIKKLKERNTADLSKDLHESREHLRVLKFELAQGKIKNVRSINETKKKIARILTFIKLQHGK